MTFADVIDPPALRQDPALGEALRAQDLVAFEALLDRGVSPNMEYPVRERQHTWAVAPLIYEATRDRRHAFMHALLRHGAFASPPMSAYWGGYGPLHAACLNGDLEAVQLLLRYGARATAVTRHGETPLHVWAQGCRNTADALPGWRALVAAGANPEARDVWRGTPLMSGIQGGGLSQYPAWLASGAHRQVRLPGVGNLLGLLAPSSMAWDHLLPRLVALVEGGVNPWVAGPRREPLTELRPYHDRPEWPDVARMLCLRSTLRARPTRSAIRPRL